LFYTNQPVLVEKSKDKLEGKTMEHSAQTNITNENKSRSFFSDAIFSVEMVKDQHRLERQTKAKHFLDAIFPLGQGAHKDATNYMLDGRHLIVYFKDGQISGLQDAGSFIAFTGHRNCPDSLLLRDKEGCYIEISFKRGTNEGMKTDVEISDILLETCATFRHKNGHDSLHGIRHWVSLLNTDEQGQPKACLDDKDFTAKNGSDYRLTRCFKKQVSCN